MGYYIDLTGNRYGSLVVQGFAFSRNGESFWNCLCDCGKQKTIRGNNLRRGISKTCGCSHNQRPHQQLVGKKFGRLTVISEIGSRNFENSKQVVWDCICDCGNKVQTTTNRLKSGNTKSCGCLVYDVSRMNRTTHGMSKTRINNIYLGMHDRCERRKNSIYKHYGARGIKVCSEWSDEHGFEHFRDWAFSNGYSDDLTLDRIDVNGNYCPDNCRWVSQTAQKNNKRNTLWVEYLGKRMSLADFSREIGAPYNFVYHRYHSKNETIDQIADQWEKEGATA